MSAVSNELVMLWLLKSLLRRWRPGLPVLVVSCISTMIRQSAIIQLSLPVNWVKSPITCSPFVINAASNWLILLQNSDTQETCCDIQYNLKTTSWQKVESSIADEPRLIQRSLQTFTSLYESDCSCLQTGFLLPADPRSHLLIEADHPEVEDATSSTSKSVQCINQATVFPGT